MVIDYINFLKELVRQSDHVHPKQKLYYRVFSVTIMISMRHRKKYNSIHCFLCCMEIISPDKVVK